MANPFTQSGDKKLLLIEGAEQFRRNARAGIPFGSLARC